MIINSSSDSNFASQDNEEDSSFIFSESDVSILDEDEEMEEPLHGKYQWTEIGGGLDNELNKSFLIENNVQVDEDCLVSLDYFLQIFSKELIEKIIYFSNKKGDKIIDNEKQKKQKRKLWKHIQFNEFKAVLGVFIAMGITNKHCTREYWNRSKLTLTPGISEVFSRERFMQICKCLTFEDIGNKKRIFENKYELLRTQIINNSQRVYIPKKELSLDESLVSFKGRVKNKVFMPLKRHRFGLKAYLITEAESSYVWNWSLFTGAKHTIPEIVIPLCLPLEGENYCIFMDRFYTSPYLFSLLKFYGFSAVGTVQRNRLNITKDQEDSLSKLDSHKSQFYQSTPDDLFLIAWKDKKLVTLLSTYEDLKVITTERYIKVEENYENIQIDIPQIIKTYSRFMGGVDRFDQSCSFFSYIPRTKRWYFRLFSHFLEISLHNSYIIYQKDTGINMKYINYRKIIMKSLVKEFRFQKHTKETTKKFSLLNFSSNKNADCELALGSKKFDCSIHKSKNEGRKQTKYYCNKCTLYVCVIPCYDEHRKLK